LVPQADVKNPFSFTKGGNVVTFLMKTPDRAQNQKHTTGKRSEARCAGAGRGGDRGAGWGDGEAVSPALDLPGIQNLDESGPPGPGSRVHTPRPCLCLPTKLPPTPLHRCALTACNFEILKLETLETFSAECREESKGRIAS